MPLCLCICPPSPPTSAHGLCAAHTLADTQTDPERVGRGRAELSTTGRGGGRPLPWTPPPPPPRKRWGQFFLNLNQISSLALLAPISLGQKFASAPLTTQHHCEPTPPSLLKGVLRAGHRVNQHHLLSDPCSGSPRSVCL